MTSLARIAFCVTAALALLATAPAARAAEATAKPTTNPATNPAVRPVVKLSAKHPDTKEDLTVLLDWNDAPECEAWARKAGEYALKVYPVIEKFLATDGFKPTREFRLLFKTMDGVAYASGTTITISAQYVTKNPEDIGMVGHELTHVIQHYRRGGESWLVEGVADYVRYYVLEPGSRRARFDIDRQTYKNSYQPAAGLLDYVERTKGPGVVSKLNAAMRAGKYDKETTFKEAAGGTPDEVWEEFKAAKKAKPPAKPPAKKAA